MSEDLEMELKQTEELPVSMYRMAEQYQIGKPVALYNMRPLALRLYRILDRFMWGSFFFVVLFLLVLFGLFFYQYLPLLLQNPTSIAERTLLEDQVLEMRLRVLLALPGVFIGCMSWVMFVIQRRMITQAYPMSFLVGMEGMLRICPKEIDVTRWDEVTYLVKMSKESYLLGRVKRKSLEFGNALEDVDGLADLVGQFVKNSSKK